MRKEGVSTITENGSRILRKNGYQLNGRLDRALDLDGFSTSIIEF